VDLQILPFGPEHVEEAGRLLADRHRRDREREPLLPAQYESAAEALDFVAQAAPASSGVAAVRGDRLAGFLIGGLDLAGPERSAFISARGHAVAADEAPDLCREMYAAAAPSWLRQGCFTHRIEIAAGDLLTREAWYSLGFGQLIYHAWRDTRPLDGPLPEVAIHQVGPDQVDLIRSFAGLLGTHHAGPPIWFPDFPAGVHQQAERRETLAQRMGEAARSYWVAYVRDQPAAFMTWRPSEGAFPEASAMLTRLDSIYLHLAFTIQDARAGGVGSALLERGLTWSRELGYALCTVGFSATNLLAARFWPSRGFRPLAIFLQRVIDPRIAWANGGDIAPVHPR